MQVSNINNQIAKTYLNSPGVERANRAKSQVQTKQFESNMEDAEKLITSKERNFFKQMFPESSDQIDRHIVFNRNGRTQAYSYAKGTIIDGRV